MAAMKEWFPVTARMVCMGTQDRVSHSSSRGWGGIREVPLLPEELLTTDGYRGKESRFTCVPSRRSGTVHTLEALSGLSGFKKESTNLGSERGRGRGGLGQNVRRFSKNSFCLKCSHSAFHLREEAHPTRKNQI